jgi:hypothetical protein
MIPIGKMGLVPWASMWKWMYLAIWASFSRAGAFFPRMRDSDSVVEAEVKVRGVSEAGLFALEDSCPGGLREEKERKDEEGRM